MTTRRIGIIMAGVTGRMGTNQHLVRSILAIRQAGGTLLSDGTRVMPDPILIGRNPEKVAALAQQYGVTRWSTDLDMALLNPEDEIFFDAGTTQMRPMLLEKAIAAGKHVYCEKPIATDLASAIKAYKLAQKAGVKNGVVQDKIFLPGLLKLKMLRDSGFFGRMVAVRGEFGYWVFEGDVQPAQRPSWNYRDEDGGGIILDMVCHWRYVLDNTFAPVKAVSCLGATHIPERWDEDDKKYKATADDAAYATFELEGGIIAHINMSWVTRVYRDDLVTFQVDGVNGSAVAGLTDCVIQPRPGHAASGLESGRQAADRFLQDLAAGAGLSDIRQWLQSAVGNVHPACRRGCAVQIYAARRRQRCAARGMRAAKLEGTAMGGCAGVENLTGHSGFACFTGALQ